MSTGVQKSISYAFFRLSLTSNGMLSVKSQITGFSTGNIQTTSAVPMDEWVYIQGYQFGNTYKVGWKKPNGVQHVVQGNIVPLDGQYVPNTYNFSTNCLHATRGFFWQPGDDMFVNMYANVEGKEVHQINNGGYYIILPLII